MLYLLAKMRVATERLLSSNSSSQISSSSSGSRADKIQQAPSILHAGQDDIEISQQQQIVLRKNWASLLAAMGVTVDEEASADNKAVYDVCMRMVDRMYGAPGVGPMTAEEGEILRLYFSNIAAADDNS